MLAFVASPANPSSPPALTADLRSDWLGNGWLGSKRLRGWHDRPAGVRGSRPAPCTSQGALGRSFSCAAQHDRPPALAPAPVSRRPLEGNGQTASCGRQQSISKERRQAWCSAFAAVLVVLAGFAGAPVCEAFQQLYETAKDIPTQIIESKAVIYGKMVAVSDGDTFRVRHAPDGKSIAAFTGKKSEHTISVRLAGIDCPELPHGTNPGQPFGPEARAALSKMLGGKTLSVQLLRRDQYGRVVAHVTVDGQSPAVALLREGLAVVYEGGGAVYGPGAGSKAELLKAQAEAQKARRGVWSLGDAFVSPSEYKRQARAKGHP